MASTSKGNTATLYTQKAQLGNIKGTTLGASSLSLWSVSSISVRKELSTSSEGPHAKVSILVRGTRFETYEDTLNRFPNTLLGTKTSRLKYYDPLHQCLSFDRNKEAFNAILFYYQSCGILSCPSDVSLECFVEEANFFGINARYMLTDDDEERLPKRYAKHPARTWTEAIWFTIEYPNYSNLARIISIFWIICIAYGIFIYCFETEKWLHKWLRAHLNFQTSLHYSIHPSGVISDVWTCMELIAVLLFSTDFLLRFLFCPQKFVYLKSPYGAIDILAMFPSYIWIALCMIDPVYSPDWFRRVVCFGRSLRVLKLIRYSYGVQYVSWVLSKTMRDIPCFNLDMFVCLIFFATLLFNAEHRTNPGNGFDSIPEAIWYVVVSMTTVGYGDVICVTLEGKLTSAACVLIGILVLVSLPTPFFFQKFGNIYTSLEDEESEKVNSNGTSK